ncbi:hypothetical protein BT69DRAFT_1320124 [Atractiella rhizophila]|nr:hypothetical protein BT69DRAFT_1320124 [Atractiella rhizophila]
MPYSNSTLHLPQWSALQHRLQDFIHRQQKLAESLSGWLSNSSALNLNGTSNGTVSDGLIGKGKELKDLEKMDVFSVSWAFFTSSFFATLATSIFLLNRIENIVPARRPTGFSLSPLQRLAYRLPSLLLLLRSLYYLLPSSALESLPASTTWGIYLSLLLTNVTETFLRAIENDLSSQNSIPLLSLAVLLHNHSKHFSNPEKLGEKEKAYMGHVDTYLFLTLLELFALHLTSCFSPPMRPIKLHITATFSFLSQFLALLALYRLYSGSSKSGTEHYMALGGSIWAPRRIPELAMEAMVFVHIFLSSLTITIREGTSALTLERVFGERSAWMDGRDEWVLALLKYTNAMLENSELTGMSNEMPPLNSPQQVSISRFNQPMTTRGRRRGLGNEIQTVRVEDKDWHNPRWSELKRLARTISRIGRYWGRQTRRRLLLIWPWGREVDLQNWRSDSPAPFIEVAEDGDSDSSWETESSSGASDSSSDLRSDDEGSDSHNEGLDELYAELNENLTPSEQAEQARLLMAHLSSRRTITRRSWATQNIQKEPDAEKRAELERARLCIICLSERRSILLWPCRCLNMCEDCRASIAERPGSESCPTCRKRIDGYSKVFLP